MAENVIINEEDNGQRLDRWLKKYYPDLAFGQMQKILRTGQIRIDGKRAKGDARIATGQAIRIPPQLNSLIPRSEMPISQKDKDFIQSLVIYKDDYLIAINKPAGIATQGGSKVQRHIDGLLEGLAKDDIMPHLVHRLDKDTSGVLIFARNAKMAREMGEVFKGREIRKYYWAVTSPAPALENGKIKSSLAKVEGAGGERVMSVSEEEGKLALTYYHVMEQITDQLAWVAFWPRTGRTHQIRVHAAENGFPLLGDYKYSREQPFLQENPNLPQELHLHARRLIFTHPVTGKKVDIRAELSPDMRKTFKAYGFNPDDRTDPFEDLD